MSSTLTIQQVINTILNEVPGGLPADTVDTFKVGDPDQPVTGIVTTFMATWEVIEKAAGLGANLIIPHEPLFFNHRDTVDWLSDDPVYLAKRRFIDEKKMTVWRFHDGWHSIRPDGVLEGLLRLLDWKSYQDPEIPELVHLPSTPLDELTAFLKVRLGAAMVRVVGPNQMVCRKAVVFPGYTWGEMQIEVLNKAACRRGDYRRNARMVNHRKCARRRAQRSPEGGDRPGSRDQRRAWHGLPGGVAATQTAGRAHRPHLGGVSAAHGVIIPIRKLGENSEFRG